MASTFFISFPTFIFLWIDNVFTRQVYDRVSFISDLSLLLFVFFHVSLTHTHTLSIPHSYSQQYLNLEFKLKNYEKIHMSCYI